MLLLDGRSPTRSSAVSAGLRFQNSKRVNQTLNFRFALHTSGQNVGTYEQVYTFCFFLDKNFSKNHLTLRVRSATIRIDLIGGSKMSEENEKYNLPCPHNPTVKCVQYPDPDPCGCDPCQECENFKGKVQEHE